MPLRPHFKEYVMARLVTIAVMLFLCFATLLYFIGGNLEIVWMSIVLLAIGFMVFIYAIHKGASRMQKELTTINNYLANLDKVEEIKYKARFFTYEFEEINKNLIKVLNKSKKREEIKHKYNAKLKLKNRQRADMISAIAHEFRNPISSIMGYSQTLVDDNDIPSSLQEKFLKKIYNNGNKIESLLARLILWNKFESKEATLHKSNFDILRLVHDVVSTLSETYKERVIEVIGESRNVDADRTLLDVVLKNLIENALKYSKDEVVITLSNTDVSIRDKGVGIGKKEIEKVTKKFYRSGTQSWDNSMGLGLSIVKSILGMHESSLEIESQKDVGSTFSFKI